MSTSVHFNAKSIVFDHKVTRVDPIIEKVIKLQLHIMASMKSCSHRTFIKGSSMELNFYAKFFYIMKRKEKVCFKKLT